MKVNVYAILDTAGQAFLQPWFAANHALAFRNLEKACRNPDSPFVQFPADFTVFCIGQFDDDTGELLPHKKHENLGNMIQFVPAENPEPSLFAADTAKSA